MGCCSHVCMVMCVSGICIVDCTSVDNIMFTSIHVPGDSWPSGLTED